MAKSKKDDDHDPMLASASLVERDAALIESFRQAIFEDKPGIWPDWVYEARSAVKHQSDAPWLPDLISILGWQGGTVHQALGCVRRMVETLKEARSRATSTGDPSRLARLVEWLTNHQHWSWTMMIDGESAASRVLGKMCQLGLIEGRHHQSTWSELPTVYRVDGKIYGRTDGVDDSLFDGTSHDSPTT